MKFKEIEFKYNADDVPLTEFKRFCIDMDNCKVIEAAGYDHFYASNRTEGFARHRIGPDLNQLTFKRKTAQKNNFIRDEDNLGLTKETTEAQVSSFLGKFGYEFKKSIFKTCFVYKYSMYTLVYYILSDVQLKEIGRYIEIELEESIPWTSENSAWNTLTDLEKQCKPLGLSPQGRIKKSLYEIVCE